MQYSNKSAARTPIIRRVVFLNKQLATYGRRLPHGRRKNDAVIREEQTVDLRRCYLYPLLEKAGVLFVYALRQLKGKDYLKRSMELVEEIQAQCYLIMELRGWNERVCAELDSICDDIAEQLHAVAAAQKASVIKSKDENERV